MTDLLSAADSDERFHTLADLAEEFLARRADGEHVSVEGFASEYVEFRDDVLALFPTLLAMDQALSPANSQLEGFEPPFGYTLINEIGRGGMGIVYRARQQSLLRDVAIKLIPPHRAFSERYRRRFNLEAQAASSLFHPNIVPIFDYGVEADTPWIAMQLLTGTTLDKLIRISNGERSAPKTSERPSYHQIARLGADVADALQTAHDDGIFHRDVKPSNLMLDDTGKIWIMDFGLAKLTDAELDLSNTGEMIGTPRYMAPEQIHGTVDGRCDVYSLGLTLYELATGSRAWSDRDSVPSANTESNFDLKDIKVRNPEVPEGLANIIMRACAFHPEDRYQSAGELNQVLARFAGGETKADRRRTVRDRRPRPYMRQCFLLMMVAIALVAGFACALLFFGQITPDVPAVGKTPIFAAE